MARPIARPIAQSISLPMRDAALRRGGGVPIIAYPVITGDAIEGETLTVTPATWDGTPDSTSNQWMRADVLVGGDIPILLDGEIVYVGTAETITAETALTYLVRNDDAGYDGKDYVIWNDETAVFGSRSYTVSSEATGPVQIATYAETIALLADMVVQPDSDFAAIINLTIGRLKYAELWPKIKIFRWARMHTAQAALLDWKQLDDWQAFNAPAFTAYLGDKGNGTNAYMAGVLAPSTVPGASQDNLTVGCWETENIASAAVALGTISASSLQVLGRNTSNAAISRVNIGSGVSAPSTDSRVLVSSTRDGANSQKLFINGVLVNTGVGTSTAPSASPFAAFRSASVYSTRRKGFDFVAVDFVDQDHADLHNILLPLWQFCEARV